MENPVLVRREGAVLVLTLNSPARLNAWNLAMFEGLSAGLRQAAADAAVRVVMLTGAGRAFCAGAELGQDLGGSAADLGALIEAYYNPIVRQMAALEMPIVAAVNGVAAGAGMNLALAADIAVAARSAQFTQAFVRIGLMPDAGGTYFLPRLAGQARARALAMLGETISADEAAAMGLIWKVYEDAGFMTEALTLANNLVARPALALAAMKRAFAASASNNLDDQLVLERDLQRELGRSADFAEGVRAFLEKRPAVFNR